jgi:hypothetical protein
MTHKHESELEEMHDGKNRGGQRPTAICPFAGHLDVGHT